MIETIITKIYRAWKSKNGKEYKTQDGRPYERVSIQIDDERYTGKWLSGFGADWNKDWKAGDKVKIVVEQKGDFLNFSKITENDLLEMRVGKLEKDVEALRAFLVVPPAPRSPEEGEIDYPEENPEDIPF